MPAPDQLPPGQQLAAPGKWPRVGEREPAPVETWRGLEITGCVERPVTMSFEQFGRLPQVDVVTDIHCVTRWSISGVRFRGVPLADLLALASPTVEARFVSFVAHSTRGHSTSLDLREALQLGTLVACQVDGRPLEIAEGGPIRVIVPGRYFYKSLKWLARIELAAEDRLGHWESVAGYHNHADPWLEQRYIVRGVNRQELARRLSSGDFRGVDMLGLELPGRELPRFRADDALLRHADFRGSRLPSASFERANLSNARFQNADLREASFRGADVEGADFRGADLRGADFRGAALLGVTFCATDASTSEAARLDAATRFDPESIDALAPTQAQFVRLATQITDQSRRRS